MFDWWTRNFTLLALPIFLGLLFLCWISPSLDYEFFCAGDNSCFREWVSALSGWAAVGAAAATIGSLFKQAEAAQKQTDFQLGDAPPTIDLLPKTDDSEELVVRIVNWNRRTLLLHSLAVTGFDFPIAIWNVKIDDVEVSFGPGRTFDPPIVIHGWEDRQGAPHNAKISIIAMGHDNALLDHRHHSIGVSVQTSLLGPVHEWANLTARYEGKLA